MSRLRISKGILIAVLSTFTVLSSVAMSFSVALAFDENKEPLVVGVLTDRCPVFYIDDETGETVGIGVDLIKAVAKDAGYDIELKNITEADLKEALDNEEYDIIMPFGSAITSASGKKSIVTNNITETPFTLVTTKHGTLPGINSLKIGMARSLKGASDTVRELYPNVEIILYDDMPDGVKLLRNDEVDALLNNSYVWSYLLQKPSYSDLHVQPSTMFSMPFMAGTLDTPKGQEIITRLNYGITCLDDTMIQAVVLDYTNRRLYKENIFDFLYKYGVILIFASLLTVGIVGTMYFRQRSKHLLQEERIRNLIDCDELTGVYNLNGFRKKATELLRENPDVPYFISYNNIIDFKFINDSFGKAAGDDLLKFWADISRSILTDKETIGRITGDQFTLLRRIDGNEKIYEDARNVVEPVNNFFINQGKNYKVQLSSGLYVLTPSDYRNIDIDHMLDFARIAEKKVHLSGKNGFEFYNLNQWETKKRSAEIVAHLSSAIEAGEVQVWYQPQVNFRTKEIICAEALCRWNHSDLGWISPGEFIPALETAGRIYELDSYVWHKVCEDLHRWNEQGKKRTISVNLSRGDIVENPNVHEFFSDLIKLYNLSVDQLHIEITETAYVEDTDLLLATTNNLRVLGFQVEMDDFGSGYSSLNMLKDLPVDKVKLDLRFLSGETFMDKGQIIVSYMIKMFQLLGINILAEGVETAEQAVFLLDEGCEEMQGFYFHKPLNVLEFEELF